MPDIYTVQGEGQREGQEKPLSGTQDQLGTVGGAQKASRARAAERGPGSPCRATPTVSPLQPHLHGP